MSSELPSDAILVDLRISAEEYLKLYQGLAREVVTRAHDGRVVRFPASILQRFVTREGVHGRFVILFDRQHKFRGIERRD